jgi:hypothetical protein
MIEINTIEYVPGGPIETEDSFTSGDLSIISRRWQNGRISITKMIGDKIDQYLELRRDQLPMLIDLLLHVERSEHERGHIAHPREPIGIGHQEIADNLTQIENDIKRLLDLINKEE